MTSTLGLLLAVAAIGGSGPRPATLMKLQGDPSPGLLVNRTVGARPFDPPDPRRPTVVFIHGFNPFPRAIRFTMAEGLSRAIASRYGAGAFNVLDWDWNDATFVGLDPRANSRAALAQGPRLAEALRRSGIAPGRLHLIGHSNGALVASSASRTIRATWGEPVAQVTFLEAARFYHDLIFDPAIAATTMARRVENIWADGPSGFGGQVVHQGVANLRVAGRTPNLGVVLLWKSAHLDVVRWYIASVGDRSASEGFNSSLLLVP